MNLWNVKNLPPPTVNSYKTSTNDINFNLLYNVLEEGQNYYKNDQHFRMETELLSRCIYRMKMKFRSAKDFKALEKVYKATNNYFHLELDTTFKLFKSLIPRKYQRDGTYFPTKNMLDYILVRLQGLGKLFVRIAESCKVAAYLLTIRLHIGHFWKIAIIMLGLVSRIFVLCKHLTKFTCGFYSKLLPFSSQLQNTSSNWLPENYELPSDLKTWLNIEWLDEEEDIVIEIPDITEANIVEYFDLADSDDDVEFFNEYIMINDEDKNDEDKNAEDNHLRGFTTDADIGEVIEIEDSFSMIAPKVKKQLKRKLDTIEKTVEAKLLKKHSSPKNDSSIEEISSDSLLDNVIELSNDEIDTGEVILIDESPKPSEPIVRQKNKNNEKRKPQETKTYVIDDSPVKFVNNEKNCTVKSIKNKKNKLNKTNETMIESCSHHEQLSTPKSKKNKKFSDTPNVSSTSLEHSLNNNNTVRKKRKNVLGKTNKAVKTKINKALSSVSLPKSRKRDSGGHPPNQKKVKKKINSKFRHSV